MFLWKCSIDILFFIIYFSIKIIKKKNVKENGKIARNEKINKWESRSWFRSY